MTDSQHQWKKTKLGDLAIFRNGINYSKENFGKGLKVINVKDFQDYSFANFGELDEINPEGVLKEEDLLKNNDIIFVRSNGNRELIGRSLFIRNCNEKISHSAFSIKLRFTSNLVYPLFYAYLFRTSLIRQTLSSQGNGTNISNLNQGILTNLEVPLPPLPAQRKIVAILSAYDELIENNTRRIEILEEMACLLYREWFVKFRFPGHENVRFVESELGLIPEGWEVIKLPEICSKVIDGTHDSPKPVSEGYHLITGKHIINGFINFRDSYFITTEEHEKVMKRSKPEKGDTILSNIGTLGSVAIVDQNLEFSIKNVALFKPLKKSYSNFIFLHFFLVETIEGMERKASGTSQRFFSLKFLRDYELIKPPESLLSKFDDLIDSIIKKRSLLNQKNSNLRKTRDLLLPKLISGEIDVEDLDINTGEETD